MSIEYTIDIQLTELGFPDILQSEESSETQSARCPPTSDDSLSSSVKSLSTARKQGLQINQDGKEMGVARHASNTTDESRPPPLAVGVKLGTAQDGDVARTQVDEHAAVNETTDGQQEPAGSNAAQEECAKFQEGEYEDDSDDSQVSYVYEEDSDDDEEEDDDDNEEEKEDDEEEGVSSVLNHSRNYHCSICDIRLSSKLQFNDHMNLHSGARPYICAECGKRFCQVNSYRAHLRTHAKAKTERHQCRICLKNYPSEEGLKFHLSVNHFETQFFECDLCKRLFPSLSECEKHVQMHKRIRGLSCRVCRRRFYSRKSLLRHRKTRCSASFRCTDCQLVFPKKNALLKHSFSHLGLLPYTCIRCQRHFRLAKLYHQHKCEPHRIHCVACLREFPTRADFEQHKKDTGCWGNQEPNAKADEIRCLECGEKFDSTDELKKHAGAHQRVLKCAECGKGFRSALLLMSHMGGHAGKSPCLCQTCGLGFPYQQNYDSHLKTCGQTPPPASTFRKRHASKSSVSASKKLSAESKFLKASESKEHSTSQISLPESKKLNKKSESSNAPSTVTTPAAVLKSTASTPNRLAPLFPAPLKSSSGLGYATNEVSGGQPSADGLWKLTVDKPPPPGLNLVLFLPVGALQTTEVPPTSGVPKTLALPAMQALSQTPLSANSHPGVNAAFSGPLNNPLDVLPSNNDKFPDAPLDLSQKSRQECLPVVKKEWDEMRVCEVKQGKVEPVVAVVKTESSTPVMQIKQEPQNPGSHDYNEPGDWVPGKKIKMEKGF